MNATRPKVVIMAGPNGAGKSTLAPSLLRDRFGLLEYVNADTIARGLSAFQPEEVAFEAGRVMLKRLHDLARLRASFAFETTLATRSYAPWLAGLCKEGYAFHLLFLWLHGPDLAVGRVKERVRLGGHGIPEAVIRRRYRHGIRNFFELYQTLAHTWGVYDNSVSVGPVLIATGSSESALLISQPELWQRFREAAR